MGLRIKGFYYIIIRGSILFRWAATTGLNFLELIGEGCSGEAYNVTKIKT